MAGDSGHPNWVSAALTRPHPCERELLWGRGTPTFRPGPSANLTFVIVQLRKPFQAFLTEDSGAESQEYLAPWLLIMAPTSGVGRGSKGTLHARH